MRQDFSNVTKERLAELFPILLEEHNSEWGKNYLKEKEFLQSIFKDKIIRINHIGSSSVPGLIAKPTVDILLEVKDDININTETEKMKDEGYIVNTPEGDIIMYIKGYTPQGFRGQAVHIHVRYSGDWGELYFRDYLFDNLDIALEYAKLKLKLQELFSHDRDGYTAAKGPFIKKYTEKAKAEYSGRYIPAK